jgi:hypothetical protein
MRMRFVREAIGVNAATALEDLSDEFVGRVVGGDVEVERQFAAPRLIWFSAVAPSPTETDWLKLSARVRLWLAGCGVGVAEDVGNGEAGPIRNVRCKRPLCRLVTCC